MWRHIGRLRDFNRLPSCFVAETSVSCDAVAVGDDDDEDGIVITYADIEFPSSQHAAAYLSESHLLPLLLLYTRCQQRRAVASWVARFCCIIWSPDEQTNASAFVRECPSVSEGIDLRVFERSTYRFTCFSD